MASQHGSDFPRPLIHSSESAGHRMINIRRKDVLESAGFNSNFEIQPKSFPGNWILIDELLDGCIQGPINTGQLGDLPVNCFGLIDPSVTLLGNLLGNIAQISELLFKKLCRADGNIVSDQFLLAALPCLKLSEIALVTPVRLIELILQRPDV